MKIATAFRSSTSILHRRDSRIKLIAAFSLSLVLALSTKIEIAIAGCIVGIILLSLAGPDPKRICKRMLLVNVFNIFLFLSLPLTYSENGCDGLLLASLITLKTNGILFCFLALIATIEPTSLGHSMEQLGIPKKLCFLFLFSYRQLFIIEQEYERLHRAAILRGFIPQNNIHTYRTYSYLFAMTLVKSWNRAERVHQAMLLRGFSGKFLCLHPRQPDSTDYLLLMVLLTVSLLLLIFSHSPFLW